jgi:hypothetical protein
MWILLKLFFKEFKKSKTVGSTTCETTDNVVLNSSQLLCSIFENSISQRDLAVTDHDERVIFTDCENGGSVVDRCGRESSLRH